jgi:phospholipid transport system substrate-binding protein
MLSFFKSRWLRISFILFVVNVGSSSAGLVPEAEIETREVVQTAKETPKPTAKEIVQIFQRELLDVMKQGEALGFHGRYTQLEKPILNSHDLTKVVRIVMGKKWRGLTAQQKTSLSEVFSRLSISAYAVNFKVFSGESFVYLSENETARGGVIVHTLLKRPEDKDVKFDYMLKKKGEHWRIINIIANGVSDLALKRSEYTSLLKRKGFESLIAKINEKIDNYAKQ